MITREEIEAASIYDMLITVLARVNVYSEATYEILLEIVNHAQLSANERNVVLAVIDFARYNDE